MKNILNKAIIFAANAHEGQVRKNSQKPYILHPIEVATIAAQMTHNTTVIAAAVLHDVIEDANTTPEELTQQFGEEVTALVVAVSENKRRELPATTTWKIRKQETLTHLVNDTKDVKVIVLADKLSNMRAAYSDYMLIGDDIWKSFNQQDKNEQAWYYTSIANAVSCLYEYPAYNEYINLIHKIFGL